MDLEDLYEQIAEDEKLKAKYGIKSDFGEAVGKIAQQAYRGREIARREGMADRFLGEAGLPHSNIIKVSGQVCSCANHHPRQRLCAAGADWSSSFQAERAG